MRGPGGQPFWQTGRHLGLGAGVDTRPAQLPQEVADFSQLYVCCHNGFDERGPEGRFSSNNLYMASVIFMNRNENIMTHFIVL